MCKKTRIFIIIVIGEYINCLDPNNYIKFQYRNLTCNPILLNNGNFNKAKRDVNFEDDNSPSESKCKCHTNEESIDIDNETKENETQQELNEIENNDQFYDNCTETYTDTNDTEVTTMSGELYDELEITTTSTASTASTASIAASDATATTLTSPINNKTAQKVIKEYPTYVKNKNVTKMSKDFTALEKNRVAQKINKIFTTLVKNKTVNDVNKVTKFNNELKEFCPNFEMGAELDTNKMADIWKAVYYQTSTRLSCFKIHIKKMSKGERSRYKHLYSTFDSTIEWNRIDLEIKSNTSLSKHFLQRNRWTNLGVLGNVIIMKEESIGKSGTVIEESPNQWMLSKNLLLMRDCDDSSIVVFSRFLHKSEWHEIVNALKDFGVRKLTGNMACED